MTWATCFPSARRSGGVGTGSPSLRPPPTGCFLYRRTDSQAKRRGRTARTKRGPRLSTGACFHAGSSSRTRLVDEAQLLSTRAQLLHSATIATPTPKPITSGSYARSIRAGRRLGAGRSRRRTTVTSSACWRNPRPDAEFASPDRTCSVGHKHLLSPHPPQHLPRIPLVQEPHERIPRRVLLPLVLRRLGDLLRASRFP